MMNLSQHDSRLISAAIGYVLAIVGAGSEGADALAGITDRKSRKGLRSATELLSRSVEGMTSDSVAPASGETFSNNLDRLREIGAGLLGASGAPEVQEATAEVNVSTVEPIGLDGKVTGPKLYQLWISHEEIHAVYHAITAVEALRGAGVLEAYESVKQYEAYADEVESFVTKFNQVHEAARKDGEVSVKSEDAEDK